MKLLALLFALAVVGCIAPNYAQGIDDSDGGGAPALLASHGAPATSTPHAGAAIGSPRYDGGAWFNDGGKDGPGCWQRFYTTTTGPAPASWSAGECPLGAGATCFRPWVDNVPDPAAWTIYCYDPGCSANYASAWPRDFTCNERLPP